MENLKKNNMDAYFVEDEAGVLEKVKEFIKVGETVAFGTSMTLFETGVIALLRNGKYNFLEGTTPAEVKEICRKSFSVDAFVAGMNAITEDGELYNIDRDGTRVGPIAFGPGKVIVVVGVNKIVKNLEAAAERTKAFAAPANNMRLSKTNPCTITGHCMNCESPDRRFAIFIRLLSGMPSNIE